MTSSCSARVPFRNYSFRLTFSLAAVALLLASMGIAQPVSGDALPDAPSTRRTFLLAAAQAQSGSNPPAITIPAGTRLNLVLANTVDSRKTKTGDQVSAQVTTPVVLNNEVVIPAGTFVQGKAQKLTRRGTQVEMQLKSASLVFPDGFVANAGGPVTMESDEWTALNNPSPGSKAAIILVPLISLPVGALIGKATDSQHTTNFAGTTFTTESHTGLVVGTTVGFAAGLGTSLALMARSHGFYIQGGAPMSVTLPQAVTLTEQQVQDSNNGSTNQPPLVPVRPPHTSSATTDTTDHGTCWTPGSPGTPDVVIPGTPPIGDSPGTPSTVIPGIPATPPTPYPCPW
jgi:hypothetical protein